MKIKLFVSALLVAAFAALGLSRGAQASAGVTQTSDPNCKPLTKNTDRIVLCTDRMTVEIQKSSGIYVSIEPAPDSMNLPNAPHVNFIGPATVIKVVDAKGQPVKSAYMRICFNDSNKANIYRYWTAADWKTWFSAKDTARWVYTPTTHDTAGMSCTSSWLPGTFTIN